MTTAVKGRFLEIRLGDTWQELRLEVSPDETVASVKARALAAQKRTAASAASYELKHGGVLVSDDATVAGAGLTGGSPLILLHRRRRPVR